MGTCSVVAPPPTTYEHFVEAPLPPLCSVAVVLAAVAVVGPALRLRGSSGLPAVARAAAAPHQGVLACGGARGCCCYLVCPCPVSCPRRLFPEPYVVGYFSPRLLL